MRTRNNSPKNDSPRDDSHLPFYLLDESGQFEAYDQRHRFFGFGLLRIPAAYPVQAKLRGLRNKTHFYDEAKWSEVSQKNVSLMKEMADIVLQSGSGVQFSALVLDKRTPAGRAIADARFDGYTALAGDLISESIRGKERFILLADEYPCPESHRFDTALRHVLSNRLKRNPVAGIAIESSKGNDLLQIADLLLGGVMYDQKIRSAEQRRWLPAKVELLEHIRQRAGVSDFSFTGRRGRFVIRRLP